MGKSSPLLGAKSDEKQVPILAHHYSFIASTEEECSMFAEEVEDMDGRKEEEDEGKEEREEGMKERRKGEWKDGWMNWLEWDRA